MKYLKGILVLFVLGIIYFGSQEQVDAYTCPEGYFCNTNGGTYPQGWYAHYKYEGGVITKYCSNEQPGFTCSGDASSCTQSYRPTRFGSESSCLAGSGGSTPTTGCCDKIPCTSTCESSCSPGACPTGYVKDPDQTGIVCRTQFTTSVSCTRAGSSCPPSVGCGSDSDTCYKLETNFDFFHKDMIDTSGPTSVSMVVDGGSPVQLSTNPEIPTHIKLPAKGLSNVQVSVPTFEAPTTSRGANYYFQVNNYGTNNEWKTWTGCDASEDYCTTMPNANNIQNLVPTSKSINEVLKEGATGQISVMYATTDMCTDTYKYSLPLEGYYVVDTEPIIDPPIEDPEDLFPDIASDLTSRGCNTTTYTGADANNPLHVLAKVSDLDGVDEIQGYILWFSKDTSVPKFSTFTPSYSTGDTTDVGILIKKNGATWIEPLIYALDATDNWKELAVSDDGYRYISSNSTNIIKILDLDVNQSTEVTFDLILEFLNSTSSMSGLYGVYSAGFDSFMVVGNNVDQSYMGKLFDWGVDLVNPIANEVTQAVHSATEVDLTWSVSDDISGIDRTILNGYRVGGLDTVKDVSLFTPSAYTTNKGTVTLGSIPTDLNEIGLYNVSNPWTFINNLGETDRLNIGENENGKIDVYATAYDKACNSSSEYTSVDLDPWFTTRGGSIYSKDSILSSPKNVASSTTLQGGILRNFTNSQLSLLDTGTEAISSRSDHLVTVLTPAIGAVEALGVYDSTNVKGVWFTNLLRVFSKMQPKLKQIASPSENCTAVEGCFMLSEDSNVDITIPKDYVCTRPTLFMSARDINITPNITNDNSHLSGCIFIAKRNITIAGGDYVSNQNGDQKIHYDYLEGFFVADNQIVFTLSDLGVDLRDGIEMKGSMIALGSNLSTGTKSIEIKRNLRLFNQINPTVVMTYDNRYSSISKLFFGTEVPIYKQEIGFKTF